MPNGLMKSMTTLNSTLSTEEHRHRCEVRQVLLWRIENRVKALNYLANVETKRGNADKLKRDVIQQWNLGNRGQPGDWKYETQKA